MTRGDVAPPGFVVRTDCRHYSGYRPCGLNPVCEGCERFEPIGHRILIIKLGAMGDVLRTTPVLTALKRNWPVSQVTWITREESWDLLKGTNLIDRLMVWGHETVLWAEAVQFDLLLNFEKEPGALGFAERVMASERRGFRITDSGAVGIADERAAEALRLGIDDDLKFNRNTKPMQQVFCEMVGLEWGGDLYHFIPAPISEQRCAAFRADHPEARDKTLVAVCTGCGPGFPTKRWTQGNLVDLLQRLSARGDTAVLLSGGERERDLNRALLDHLGSRVIDGGCHNTFDEFAGLLMACDAVVTADSMPMHLAVALGKTVVALFGPTTPREVALGTDGEKVVTAIDCSPCYLTSCPETKDGHSLCMEQMRAAEVLEALERALSRSVRRPK